jgi:hypothetical protein
LKDDYAYEIPEEQRFTPNYPGYGFILDAKQPNQQIIFTIEDRIIRVFYKKISQVKGEGIIYYQKDIPKEEINDFVIKFELTENDIIAKRNGK